MIRKLVRYIPTTGLFFKLILLLVILMAAYGIMWVVCPRGGSEAVVSVPTTFVTSPLDRKGLVDFEAVLSEGRPNEIEPFLREFGIGGRYRKFELASDSDFSSCDTRALGDAYAQWRKDNASLLRWVEGISEGDSLNLSAGQRKALVRGELLEPGVSVDLVRVSRAASCLRDSSLALILAKIGALMAWLPNDVTYTFARHFLRVAVVSRPSREVCSFAIGSLDFRSWLRRLRIVVLSDLWYGDPEHADVDVNVYRRKVNSLFEELERCGIDDSCLYDVSHRMVNEPELELTWVDILLYRWWPPKFDEAYVRASRILAWATVVGMTSDLPGILRTYRETELLVDELCVGAAPDAGGYRSLPEQ